MHDPITVRRSTFIDQGGDYCQWISYLVIHGTHMHEVLFKLFEKFLLIFLKFHLTGDITGNDKQEPAFMVPDISDNDIKDSCIIFG